MRMQKKTPKELIALALDDLLNDSRLTRLFSKDVRDCALQLWILQIRSEQSTENRVVYGRLVPYSYSNNSWSSSENDDLRSFGQFQVQLVRLNLYAKSLHCEELLRQLCIGRTISAISEELKLGLSEKLKTRFGATALASEELVYRPVAYLLNRDACDRTSISSPHGGAGAFSASISRADKGALFRLGKDYDAALTEFVVEHLNADTGLDFGGIDTARFGDLELMVFPALDDLERPLLRMDWADAPLVLAVRFNPIQVLHFSGFQFRLSIENNNQITYSGIASAERDAEGVFQCKFEMNEQLHATTDSIELEIFGFDDGHSRQGTLCCRWRGGFIREIHIQGHVVGHGTSQVKFQWLEKATRPSELARVKAALIIDRGNLGFANHIGGRNVDSWVSTNRELVSLFARLHPSKSEGHFFQRWSQGDGEGRLQFVEWFRALLTKYQQHQIIIFDPYFENAGLGLLLICAAPAADYVIFRSLPKPSNEREAAPDELDKLAPNQIGNLIASCDRNSKLLKRVKLRIYGLRHGRLHDRYILIMAPDGLPVAGFNLSNSFQQAAENYPLLVTPIPADVLLSVEQYKLALIREAQSTRPEDEIENRSMRLLFDSTAVPVTTRLYEPLRFLEKAQAGNVLSVLTGEMSLQSLSGSALKERMAALGLLKDDRLVLPETAGLHSYFVQRTIDLTNFAATWETLGDVLAHSHVGADRFDALKSEHNFLGFLAQFLEASFNRAYDEAASNELAVMDTAFFQKPIEALLHSSYRPHHFFHTTKYTAVNWPEYFAIKFLWEGSPEALLAIAESHMVNVPVEAQSPDVMPLSLLSQIVSEISLSIEFQISEAQRDRLICSKNSLLHWMGLIALERALENSGGLASALRVISTFSHSEQIQTLGWMIHRAAGNSKTPDIYKDLVAALHKALPTTISADELRCLIDSMRGHMRQLAWAEPWLFQDVIFPLLQNHRADTSDACNIWIQELVILIEPLLGSETRLFSRVREGQTTNIAAFLFAYSSPERQRASLESMRSILKRRQRILQQPLASTSDWARWNSALIVSMWILTFTRWSQYYLRGRAMTDRKLEQLSRDARELAMLRPMNEWRSMDAGNQGELAAFLDQVDELLTSNDESKSGDQ